jgi:hypothetical protein
METVVGVTVLALVGVGFALAQFGVAVGRRLRGHLAGQSWPTTKPSGR